MVSSVWLSKFCCVWCLSVWFFKARKCRHVLQSTTKKLIYRKLQPNKHTHTYTYTHRRHTQTHIQTHKGYYILYSHGITIHTHLQQSVYPSFTTNTCTQTHNSHTHMATQIHTYKLIKSVRSPLSNLLSKLAYKAQHKYYIHTNTHRTQCVRVYVFVFVCVCVCLCVYVCVNVLF